MHYVLFFVLLFPSTGCKNSLKADELTVPDAIISPLPVLAGAEAPDLYLPLLKGKKVAGVFNQSSLKGESHVVDFLLSQNVIIEKIFTLEHGFRGEADAGAKILDEKDEKTGIDLVSLYGEKKKPNKSDLKGIEVVVFDVQDVGVRFYTFISTLHYIMEACAENGIPIIIFDRPNPNAHYVDGPMLDVNYKSFVGMHKVPTVYGMTIGEYGKMIMGEGWINDAANCDLTVIPCSNYTHKTKYILPVKPSPNLPNHRSILLYPSLCFFEGTSVSVGRGTDKQFQCIGHPSVKNKVYTFTPVPKPGAMTPKLQDKLCYGDDLSTLDEEEIFIQQQLNINYVLEYFKYLSAQKQAFFTRPDFFDKLAGTDVFRKQITAGKTEQEIRNSWQEELEEFKKIRFKYLIY